MYRVIDVWTTEFGEWFESGREYSIKQEYIDRYKDEDIPQRGADHHIVAKVPAGAHVQIVNRYDNSIVKDFISPGVWFDFPMSGSSSYNPDRGEIGPWNVVVDGQVVVEGIGMPNKRHVSTFLNIERVGGSVPEVPPDGPEVPEIPEEPDHKNKIWVEVVVDGEMYGGWVGPLLTSFYPAMGGE